MPTHRIYGHPPWAYQTEMPRVVTDQGSRIEIPVGILEDFNQAIRRGSVDEQTVALTVECDVDRFRYLRCDPRRTDPFFVGRRSDDVRVGWCRLAGSTRLHHVQCIHPRREGQTGRVGKPEFVQLDGPNQPDDRICFCGLGRRSVNLPRNRQCDCHLPRDKD